MYMYAGISLECVLHDCVSIGLICACLHMYMHCMYIYTHGMCVSCVYMASLHCVLMVCEMVCI